MKKLTTKVITNWLLDKGFLEQQSRPNGKTTRRPTKQGEHIGLFTEARMGANGEYHIVLYSEAAQRFVLDNFEAIVEAYLKR